MFMSLFILPPLNYECLSFITRSFLPLKKSSIVLRCQPQKSCDQREKVHEHPEAGGQTRESKFAATHTHV